MRQLRYAGPGEDAAHVIVEAVDGSDRFTLVLDDDLRSAARQELPRLDRPEPSSAALSPREIQTRVRGGASADAIAEESGLPVDRVMRFAYPVLQERIRVADEARRARARRASAHGEMGVFGEIVDGRLAVHGIEPTEVTWDSFRRPDGQWTITAGWRESDVDRFAQWNFVLSTRVISPLDETAGDLLSDRPLRPVGLDEPDGVEDVATVGGPFDAGDLAGPAGVVLADPNNPTGPLPAALRVAAPVAVDDDPTLDPDLGVDDPRGFGRSAGGPTSHPSQYQAPDPAPRGLDSFFRPRSVPEVRDLPAARAGAAGAGADEQLDLGDPALPLGLTDSGVADSGPGGGPGGRRFRGPGRAGGTPAAAEPDPDSAEGKAARARIPSWDDILLGVRRRGD